MMEKSTRRKMSFPSAKAFTSPQMSLFQDVLCNNDLEREQLSNSICFWDSIPRYSISRQAMDHMRDERGFLDLLSREFFYRDSKYMILIQPALIHQTDKFGVTKQVAYYPSASEELVEEALRKIAMDQNHGFFDAAEAISGVVFSLYQLRDELKRRGHTRSYDEVVLSLEILARSFIQIEGDTLHNKYVKRSNYFQEVVSVSRKELASDPNAKWLVRFHPLVTQGIEKLSYRQFNYGQLMGHTRQLTRWLNRLLIDKYVFASRTNTFIIYYSTIKRDSAMLNNYARERKAQEECDYCINELMTNNVIHNIDRAAKTGVSGKIVDIVYTLTPSSKFVAEVKAAQKRKTLSTSPQ